MRPHVLCLPLAVLAAASPLLAQNNLPGPGSNQPASTPGNNPPGNQAPPTPAIPREHDAKAVERLNAMSQAFKSAKTLSFTLKYSATGPFFAGNPRIEFRVIMMRSTSDPAQWVAMFSGSSTLGDAVTPIVALSDGQRRYWVDEPNRTAMERPIAQATAGPANAALIMGTPPDLFTADPLATYLQAQTIRWEGPGEVDGTPVEAIKVDPGPDLVKTRLWISTKDGLPRKVERVFEGGMTGSYTYLITKLQVNPALREDQFRIDVPEGWNISRSSEGPLKYFNATRHAPDAPSARPPGPEIGQLAPDFELKQPDGKSVKLSEQRGKVVVLDFWGTWCIPCRKSSPEVQALHEKFKDRPVKVFGLAVREADPDAPVKLMKEKGFTYGLLLKADDVAKAYKIKRFPSFFVIGFDGEVLHAVGEYKPEESFAEITKKIEAYLQSRERKAEPPADAGGNPAIQDKQP